ncbi:MAG: alpha-L-fucosidase [Candidatus Aminicenantes bacterium]|nr:alpha-L-fucosidase [Candidatus Aminicenantes bacterium]
MKKILITINLFFIINSILLYSSEGTTYLPSESNLKAREWFRQAKFGLFIHWGLYSILGEGEWVMFNRRIPVSDYEKLASFFNPIAFDPKEWISLAKEAGMRYIVITARHHDGFSLFATRATDYNIVKATPYGRDILKMLADESQRQGIKLGFYYSLVDWHHPDYAPRTAQGELLRRGSKGDWGRYLDFMKTQIRELLTHYGEVLSLWLDGHWDAPQADWRYDELYNLIHSLQPQVLIGNNHHLAPFPGEDFQMFEKDLPGGQTQAFNIGQPISSLPLEMCETINNSWGFNLHDRHYKSPKELIHLLVKAAGYDSNLLLNVGPMPNGKIQPEFVDRLLEVGRWLRIYGESIYGTRGGPLRPQPWGVTTRKDSFIYVHLLNYEEPALLLPGFNLPIKSANLMKNGQKINFRHLPEGLILNLLGIEKDPIDTIIRLEIKPKK